MSETNHRLLKRQLKRYLGAAEPDALPKEVQEFIAAVNEAYVQSDADRAMLEHSLELTSQELLQANAEMQATYRRLIESSADGIFAFDRQRNFTVWNPVMERVTGLTALKTLGKNALDVFQNLRETGEDKFFDDALAGNAALVEEAQFIARPAGERKYFEGAFSPLAGESGEIIGGLATIRDVTERRLAAETLKRQFEEISLLNRQYLIEAWEEYSRAHAGLVGLQLESGEVRPAPGLPASEPLGLSAPTLAADGKSLFVPITLRDQTIGEFALSAPEEKERWTGEDLSLAQTIVSHVALAIENARLLEQTQNSLADARRLARRERVIADVTDKITRGGSVKHILQITAEELRRVTGSSGAVVHLTAPPPETETP